MNGFGVENILNISQLFWVQFNKWGSLFIKIFKTPYKTMLTQLNHML